MGVHIGDQVAPLSMLVRRGDLFELRFVSLLQERAPLVHYGFKSGNISLPVRFRILSGTKSLGIVGDIIFVIDPLEALQVGVVVVGDVRERFPNAVDRIFGLPGRLFNSHAIDGITNRNDPPILVIATCKLLEKNIFCTHINSLYMTPYTNSSGKSGIVGFEIKREAILVEFRHGGKYLYDYETTGRGHVEDMKVLALEGRGLASYINRHVRDLFAKKFGTSAYKIRLATSKDAAGLRLMLEAYLPENYGSKWNGTVEALESDLEKGVLRIVVAERERKIVGFLAYVDTYDLHWCVTGADVIDFYVRPDQRGLGAAIHLVTWVANEISHRGGLFIKSNPVENPAVRRLYERVALFQPSGEAYISGRALRELASLSGKAIREIVRNLPKPEWGREA